MKNYNIDIDLTDENGKPTELELSESDIEFLANLFLPLIKAWARRANVNHTKDSRQKVK